MWGQNMNSSAAISNECRVMKYIRVGLYFMWLQLTDYLHQQFFLWIAQHAQTGICLHGRNWGGGGGGFLRTTDIWQFQTMYNIFQHINFKLIIQPLYIYQTYSFNYSNKHTWVYNYVQQCHANCNYKYYTLPNIMRIHLPISTLRKLDCDFQYIMTFSVVAYSKAHYIYIWTCANINT